MIEFAVFAELINVVSIENKCLCVINHTKQSSGIKDKYTCYSCQKQGHIAQNYPDKASSSNSGTNTNDTSSGSSQSQNQSQNQGNGQPHHL